MIEVQSYLTLALLTGLCIGQNILEPGPVNGTAGGSVWLQTKVSPPAKPYIAILWSINLEDIITYFQGENFTAPAYRDRIFLNESTGSLELQNLTLNDSGVYSLDVVLNGSAARHGEISLHVFEKISDPSIKPSRVIVIVGETSVSLTCEAQGSIINIEWTKNGKPLTPGDRITFHGDNRTLMITQIERTDTGEYKCQLSNPVSAMTAHYNMTVNYGPLDVSVNGTGEISASDNTTFTCSADSQPPAILSWSFNDKETGVTGPLYKIENSKVENSGNYTCTASNHITGDKASATHMLIVNGGSSSLSGGIMPGTTLWVSTALFIFYTATCS